jgi:hypothetical protein
LRDDTTGFIWTVVTVYYLSVKPKRRGPGLAARAALAGVPQRPNLARAPQYVVASDGAVG